MLILNSRSETRRGLRNPFDGTFRELKEVGSVAYKLGLTAAGKADIFASLRPKNEWDICAGNCIINEAGGKLIDLHGNPRKYNLEKTLIEPGLIAGDVEAVDKTFEVLNCN
jgi:myo-inositol-1(or 4)-monophosphatase